MKKLWKVTVNSWGWDHPRTLYATSRAAAQAIAETYPAADPVEYAGNYTDENARQLLNGTTTAICQRCADLLE